MFKILAKRMTLHLLGGRGSLLLEIKKQEERSKKKKEKGKEKRKMGREEEKEGRKENRKEMREAGRDHCYTLSPWVWNCKAESQREFHIQCHTENQTERKPWSEKTSLLIFSPCAFCHTFLGSKHYVERKYCQLDLFSYFTSFWHCSELLVLREAFL